MENVNRERTGAQYDTKLRSSDFDLKIIVQTSTDENGAQDAKEYNVHSQVFAKYSKFIDTSLSVDMMEKATREIHLSDVSPDTFELAILYLEDPLAIRAMTAEDALLVVDFYDKYEFLVGMRLCDQVLADFICSHRGKNQSTFPEFDIGLLVSACASAQRCHLEKATVAAVKFIQGSLSIGNETNLGATMFNLEHIRQLHSLLIYHADELSLESTMEVTKDEIESCLFPKYFLEKVSTFCNSTALKMIRLSVTGINSIADGEYRRDGDHYVPVVQDPRSIADQPAYVASLLYSTCYISVEILKSSRFEQDWVVESIDNRRGNYQRRTVLWRQPNSRNLDLPPEGDQWVPVDPIGIRDILGAPANWVTNLGDHRPNVTYSFQ